MQFLMLDLIQAKGYKTLNFPIWVQSTFRWTLWDERFWSL